MTSLTIRNITTRYRVAPNNPSIRAAAEAAATAVAVPAQALHLQALINLPRIADEHGLVPADIAVDEIERLALDIPPSNEWYCGDRNRLRDLQFWEVDEPLARDICERFHYLHSHRDGSRYFALRLSERQRPVIIAVASPLDVAYLGELAGKLGALNPVVISRVFGFIGAPRNSVSRLLSLVAAVMRRDRHDALITYVNPNLGFTGTSYRASGWHLLGSELGTTYRYLDRRYITDRVLARIFGRRSDREYLELLRGQFAVSRMPLRPLLVFGRLITRPGANRLPIHWTRRRDVA